MPDRDDAYIMTDFVPEEGIAEKYAVQTVPLNSNFPRKLQQIGVQEVFVADVLDRDSKLLHGIALAIESLGMELALSVALADMSQAIGCTCTTPPNSRFYWLACRNTVPRHSC